MKKILNYHLSPDLNSKINHWVVQFIIETIGLAPVFKKDLTDDVHLSYTTSPLPAAGKNTLAIVHQPADVINRPVQEGGADPENGVLLRFDFIHAIKSFLTDEVNQGLPKNCFDVHGRLNSLNSFQKTNGFQDKPMVNLYLDYLKKYIEKHLGLVGIPLFPKDAKSVVILSHDVDDPVKYAILQHYSPWQKNLNAKQWIHYNLEAGKKMAESLLRQDGHTNWAFEEIMDYESKHGFLSTFFFAPRIKTSQHANYTYDVPYEIDHPKFIGLFKQMRERNFEVGLHISYNGKQGQALIREEKDKLEHLSGGHVLGSRHHFWMVGDDAESTLTKHANAGLKYDSSLAFNDAPGYRRSIALPYYPFNKQTETTINNLQIPTFLMDSNVMKNPEFGPAESFEQAKKYILQFLKTGGVGAIDWHVRTSFPKNKRFKLWGETYLKILDFLAEQPQVWVTSFAQFYQWMEERTAKLQGH